MNGDYRRNNTYRKGASRGISVINHSNKTMDSDSYLELREADTYDVKASRESNHEELCVPGEVHVTRDIRVESQMV